MRPIIDTTDKELHHIVEEATDALLASNDPPVVFARGDVLVRKVDGEDGLYLDPYTRHTFKERLSRSATWQRRTNKGGISVTKPDTDAVGYLLDKKEYPDIPNVDRVVTTPIFDSTGKLLVTPGYQPSTKTLYVPGEGLESISVPKKVSKKALKQALGCLDEAIGNDEWMGFPFAGEADRANAIALFLLPFLRELIPGPTPLHLIDAPTAGTGKGLAAFVLTYPGVGNVALTPDPNDANEWRKVITSLLSRAPSLIMLDNITGVLGGSALEAALTAPVWEDRILGVSRMMRAKVRNIWVATSNNAKLSSDMPRRCVRIRLDAGVERPAERSSNGFRHADVKGWVLEHRPDLVQAGLTMCKAWVQVGMPQASISQGSYEDWSRVLGGVLDVCGVPGFLANRDELYESSNTEHGEMADFLQAWHELAGSEPVLARSLAEQLSMSNVFRESAPTALTPFRYGDKLTQQVGYLLRRHKDAVFGGMKLEAATTSQKRATKWRVVPAEEPAQ